MRANDLKVSVHEGKATLTGKVEDSVNKDLAKQIALGVDGVKDVDNQIVVQADYAAGEFFRPQLWRSDRRCYDHLGGEVETGVEQEYHGLTANVATKRGKVSLMGTADSAAAKDFAGKLAMNTRGVSRWTTSSWSRARSRACRQRR